MSTGEAVAVPRVLDIYAALPSITGKLELEYEGELKGGDAVARELIRLAVGKALGRGGCAPTSAGEQRRQSDQGRHSARAEQRQTPDAQRRGPSGRGGLGHGNLRMIAYLRPGHRGLTRARIPGDAPHGCVDDSCGACAGA